MTSKDKVPHC